MKIVTHHYSGGKDSGRAKEAAEVMWITAGALKGLGIIERIIEEPDPANMENLAVIAETMKNEIVGFLQYYGKFSGDELIGQRYQRFRKF